MRAFSKMWSQLMLEEKKDYKLENKHIDYINN
jgi:hypothetical protein